MDFMESKKAVTQAVLAWVFIAIVGGLFIFLAYRFINNYEERSESEFNQELRIFLYRVFNDVLSTNSIEETLIKRIDRAVLDERSFKVKCLPTGETTIYIDEEPIKTDSPLLENYPLVSTPISSNKKEDIVLMVKTFRLPFPVTPLLAITTQKHHIIFVEDGGGHVDKLYEHFQEIDVSGKISMDKVRDINLVDLGIIRERNLDSVTIVGELDIIDDSKCSDDKVTCVEIAGKDDGSGTIKIGNLKDGVGNGIEFSFYDPEEEFALQSMALFSTSENFKCFYETLEKQMNESILQHITKNLYMIKLTDSNLDLLNLEDEGEDLEVITKVTELPLTAGTSEGKKDEKLYSDLLTWRQRLKRLFENLNGGGWQQPSQKLCGRDVEVKETSYYLSTLSILVGMYDEFQELDSPEKFSSMTIRGLISYLPHRHDFLMGSSCRPVY